MTNHMSHSVSPEDIKELRLALSESLAEFGLSLKRAIDPRAEIGFTKQYIFRLECGKNKITPELAEAFYMLAGSLDEVPAGTGGMTEIQVLGMAEQIRAGTVIPRGTVSRHCARPGCPVWFIATHPRQKYHDPECAKMAAKNRRK
jgi:hypothetical protein